jgi:hypothetical protein
MPKTKVGSTYYLILGLILFPIGLLMLFNQPSMVSLISNIMPGTQTIEIFGTILMFLGEGLICFGIIGAISNRIEANAEFNRQVLQASAVRNMQEQTALVTGIKKSVEDHVALLHTKINQLYVQNTAFTRQLTLPANCKFCGTKLENSPFCPSCGKAN